jgi:hypothetical protein
MDASPEEPNVDDLDATKLGDADDRFPEAFLRIGADRIVRLPLLTTVVFANEVAGEGFTFPARCGAVAGRVLARTAVRSTPLPVDLLDLRPDFVVVADANAWDLIVFVEVETGLLECLEDADCADRDGVEDLGLKEDLLEVAFSDVRVAPNDFSLSVLVVTFLVGFEASATVVDLVSGPFADVLVSFPDVIEPGTLGATIGSEEEAGGEANAEIGMSKEIFVVDG